MPIGQFHAKNISLLLDPIQVYNRDSMKTLVISQHLAPFVTGAILERLKKEFGDDVEIRVEESIIARHQRGEDIPTIAEKEHYPMEREPLPKVDRAEQRRRNKAVNQISRHGRYAR